MAQQTTTPDAEQPATVCEKLHDGNLVSHVSGEVNIKSKGSTYKVTAWVDDESTAGLVAEVGKQLQRSGYDVTLGTVASTASVKITGEAEA